MLKKVAQEVKKIDLEKITLSAFEENKEEAIDYNTEEQLFKRGVDSKGASLGEYTPFTKGVKQSKGQRYDHITLKDEGDFYDGFFVKAQKFPIIFDSKDSKRNELVEKFGEDIFGLTKESLKQLTKDQLLVEVQEQFKKQINQAFKLLS